MTRAPLALTILAAVLAGCAGGDLEGSQDLPGSGLVGRLTGQPAPAAPDVALPENAPKLFVAVELTRVGTEIALAESSGGYETWLSVDRTTVTTRRGLVTATRGLWFDLLSADVEQAAAAIAAGRAASYRRSLSVTGGERDIVTRRYDCTLAPVGTEAITIGGRTRSTTRLAEKCGGADGAFQNDYWVSGGVIWQSRQFLDPAGGYLQVQRL